MCISLIEVVDIKSTGPTINQQEQTVQCTVYVPTQDVRAGQYIHQMNLPSTDIYVLYLFRNVVSCLLDYPDFNVKYLGTKNILEQGWERPGSEDVFDSNLQTGSDYRIIVMGYPQGIF